MYDAPHFHDENAARKRLETIHWPDGAVCPHCGSTAGHYRLAGAGGGGAKGEKARPGLLKCKDCREQFSVTEGTVFEHSKIPLTQLPATAYPTAVVCAWNGLLVGGADDGWKVLRRARGPDTATVLRIIYIM